MNSSTADLAVVGAGPAGLSAAIQAARRGLSVIVVDSNLRAGGQLIKQIHKFFGSHEHSAGTRGIDIASQLYDNAISAGVKIWLDSTVYGIFPDGMMEVSRDMLLAASTGQAAYKAAIGARAILLATGASENSVAFPGWTLPGVMGAGAAQTMVNVERVLPGKRVVMIGSGNVGLIVSYQLMQAGAKVLAVVEAAPKIGGYGVHAAKIARAGVPILTGHTVSRAFGSESVEGVEIVQVNKAWQPVPGSEKTLPADTVCIAAGLRPYTKLAALVGCGMRHSPVLGGWVPVHDENMMTTVPGVYVAGDLAGVEEASVAMEEGCLAGLAVAQTLSAGRLSGIDSEKKNARLSLRALREGPFGEMRQQAKDELCKVGDQVS